MLTRRHLMMTSLSLLAAPALVTGATTDFRFPNIDGGEISLAELRGQPVLVVNTASLCGFTPQYDALQALHERFAGRATILAVPSDDFGDQELETAEAVKEFCAVNYDLTLPMTDITVVRGRDAHPFYQWAQAQGAVPRWNFHKILLNAEGAYVADFPSHIAPDNPRLIGAIEALLTKS